MNISRHSLIYGLSYALDILGKNNLSHSKSTAYLSTFISRELKISEDDILDIYYAALLHDIGVSDEFISRALYAANMKRHCLIGHDILKKLPLSKDIADYVLYHHEYSDGSGAFGLLEKNISFGAQVISFSSDFDDVFGRVHEYDMHVFSRIEKWLEDKAHLYRREIPIAFSRLIKQEMFLLDYFNHETRYKISDKIGISDDTFYDTEDVKKFAYCFSEIIDQRSPFTFHHSNGIAELAKLSAGHLGYDEEIQSKMYIAGLLHDIGKLHTPTSILHKNGALTPEERFEMNKHIYYTRKILEQVEGFEEIVEFAANHHEKLDGTGYPRQMRGEDMSELEKVMCICDVFQALTEERPYRSKLPLEKVFSIIEKMVVRKHLDGVLYEKIKSALSEYKESIETWSNDYASGFSDIDLHHKTLYRMTNTFIAKYKHGAPSNIILNFLDDLIDYGKMHFIVEEEMMIESDYPLINYHISKHNDLIDAVMQMKNKIRKDMLESPMDVVTRFVINWLSHHIEQEDLTFFNFCKNKHYDLGKHFAGRRCIILTMNNEVVGDGKIETVSNKEVIIENISSKGIPVESNDVVKISSVFEDQESQTFIAKVSHVSVERIKVFNATIVQKINDRKDFRVPVKVEAILHFLGEAFPILITDISAGGMMLESMHKFEKDIMVSIEFLVYNNCIIQTCEIVRVESGEFLSSAYGVRFEDMNKTDSDVINSFIFNRKTLDRRKYG